MRNHGNLSELPHMTCEEWPKYLWLPPVEL